MPPKAKSSVKKPVCQDRLIASFQPDIFNDTNLVIQLADGRYIGLRYSRMMGYEWVKIPSPPPEDK